MDIFQIPRILLCESSQQSVVFDANDYGQIGLRIFLRIKREFHIQNKLWELYNDAYYICVLAMLDDSHDTHMNEYQKIASGMDSQTNELDVEIRTRIVLGIVYVYLSCVASASDAKLRKFRRLLRDAIDIEFVTPLSLEIIDTIPDSAFAPRKLTRELLDYVDWKDVTDGFQPEIVLKIQNILGRNMTERMMIFNAILRSANQLLGESQTVDIRLKTLKDIRNRLAHSQDYFSRDDEAEKEVDVRITETVDEISEKIGEATIPLKILVEGIKKRARLKGLDDAILLSEHLNNILYDVPEWHKNVPELENFFIDAREKREAKERGILMTGEHATYNENNNN